MPQFQYRAKDPAKGNVSGTVEAQTQVDAAAKVREMGYYPMDIAQLPADKVAAPPPRPYDTTSGGRTSLLPKVSPLQMSVFWRQLATMSRTGMTLTQSLALLAQHTQLGSIRAAARGVLNAVQSGSQLSEAMRRYPRVFSEQHVMLIRAGEKSGMVEIMSEAIADDLDRQVRLKRSITAATLYPIILLLAVIFIPHLGILITRGGVPYLQATVGGLVPIVLWGAAILIFGRLALQIPINARIYDEIKLALPVIGPTIRRLATARFCRVLGDLYRAGVPIMNAMTSAASSCGNRTMARRLGANIGLMEQGGKITDVMREARVFSPMVLSMASTGETTGDLNTMLAKVADHLEAEAQAAINSALVIGGVLLFLIIALVAAVNMIHDFQAIADSYKR